MPEAGKVFLVGAGPGDPELITVKGRRLLRSADVVIHDRLVGIDLLDLVPRRSRRICVGKAPGHQPWPQTRINALLIAEAKRGRRVVRLKGGDPFVLGRGGEECLALRLAGVAFELVPGVSSAIAAPAYAGVPVTHRGVGRAFAVVTGQTAGQPDIDWEPLARIDTLVILMGLGRLAEIVASLLAAGRDPTTPVAVIAAATTREQLVVRGSLGTIATSARHLSTPATIVVGAVTGSSLALDWFEPVRPSAACGLVGREPRRDESVA